MIQWLRLPASNAGDVGLICSWETSIPYASPCGQKETKQSEQTNMYLNIFFFLQQTVLEHFWAIFCAMSWTYRNEYDRVCILLDFVVFYKIYSCLLKKLEIKVKNIYITQWDHNPWITTVNILVWSLSTKAFHPKEVILCIPFVICSLLCYLLTRKYLSIW